MKWWNRFLYCEKKFFSGGGVIVGTETGDHFEMIAKAGPDPAECIRVHGNIGIHKKKNIAPRPAGGSIAGCRRANGLRELDNCRPGQSGCFRAAVATAIGHHNDFFRLIVAIQQGAQAMDKGRAAIANRDDDGYGGCGRKASSVGCTHQFPPDDGCGVCESARISLCSYNSSTPG